MQNSEYIKIVDRAFQGMILRNETQVTVRLFSHLTSITLPSGGIQQTLSVKIILVCDHQKKSIKLLYRDKNIHELLSFMTDIEKEYAIVYLKSNRILPTQEEFLEAKSLLNTLGAAAIIAGCDYYC
ncbi:MAG: hypothetical protein WCL02_04775 [bacterium]